MTQTEFNALTRVVGHLWDSEKNHYEEGNREYPEHIFNDLDILSDLIKKVKSDRIKYKKAQTRPK
jgi:hypothetical protein